MAPAGGRPAPTRLLYILAASHSGSTLLAMLLGTHPDLSTVGELKATSLGDATRYRCSCRELIGQCGFWSGVTADLRRQGLDFDLTRGETDVRSVRSAYARWLLGPLHRGPALERARDLALGASPRWRAHRQRGELLDGALAAAICARTGTSAIVDSSKAGIRLKYLLRNPALDVRVIRLVRDGRAVALTYMDPGRFADASDPHLRGGGTGVAPTGHCTDMAGAAREWRRSNEEAEAIVARLDRERWTDVRYEALCVDTEATLRRLFAFAGVDSGRPRPALRAAEHHVIGNGMRLDASGEVRVDERWRDVLTPGEIAAFDAEAGALNRRLGYPSLAAAGGGGIRVAR
ncbi:MAG TPA: sulfotransferase [Candidatus Binatia bacterium]|nr:sulfotransferase [Candidatus Binatia bacterium]